MLRSCCYNSRQINFNVLASSDWQRSWKGKTRISWSYCNLFFNVTAWRTFGHQSRYLDANFYKHKKGIKNLFLFYPSRILLKQSSSLVWDLAQPAIAKKITIFQDAHQNWILNTILLSFSPDAKSRILNTNLAILFVYKNVIFHPL